MNVASLVGKMKRVTKKVGKYEIGRTIGEGTFAKVKFAKNTETGEAVAIKVLAKSTILKNKMVDQVWLCIFYIFSTNLKCPSLIYINIIALSCYSLNADLYCFCSYFLLYLQIFSFLSADLQIKREISITKMMRHPNIVRLHEVYI